MKLGITLLALVGICAGQIGTNARCVFYRERAFIGSALYASIRIDGDAPKHMLGSRGSHPDLRNPPDAGPPQGRLNVTPTSQNAVTG